MDVSPPLGQLNTKKLMIDNSRLNLVESPLATMEIWSSRPRMMGWKDRVRLNLIE